MIRLFINYDNFINNFNYIYSIFYHLNIKIKIINSFNDILIYLKDKHNEYDEYIFYEIFNIDLFTELKLLYNINIYYFIYEKKELTVLNENYKKIKFILLSNNYFNLNEYKNEKLLLLKQFDIDVEYNINKITSIYLFNDLPDLNNILIKNNIDCNLLIDNKIQNSIIIFDNINISDEDKINEYILDGNYVLIKEDEKINYLYFNHFIIKYNNYEEIINIVKDIKSNFDKYKLNYINYVKYYKQKLCLDNKKFYQNIEKYNEYNNNFGFIILRHVNSLKTNNLWYNNIKNIRKYYKNKIYIIDDNSNYEYIVQKEKYIDIELIQSTYHQRGEILPYYYLYIKQLFKRCLIIHDSIIINKYIDFSKYQEEIHYLWHFGHNCNNLVDENKMMKILNNEKIIEKYDEKGWYGCFGVQTLIDYDFIEKLQKKYKLFDLLKFIDSRNKRMNFERVFSVLCTLLDNDIYERKSIYGDIHDYMEWGYDYEKYVKDKDKDILDKFDLIKIWNGR